MQSWIWECEKVVLGENWLFDDCWWVQGHQNDIWRSKILKILPSINISSVVAEPASNLPDSLNGEDKYNEEILDGDTGHPPNEEV